jgi:putative ABC transport system permease protein
VIKLARLGIIRLAKQNIRHRLFRTFVIIISVGLAAGLIFSTTILMQGVRDSVRIGTDRLGADLLVVPQGAATEAENVLLLGEPTTFYMDEDVVDKIDSIEGIEQVSPQLYIISLLASCCIFGEAQLVGFDPQTDFSIRYWVRDGLDQPPGKNDIVVGHYIISPIGSPLRFYGHDFTVAGKLEPTGMGFDKAIFIPMEGAREMINESGEKAAQKLNIEPNQISSVLVRIDRSTFTPSEVALKIQAGVPEVSVVVANRLVEGVNVQLSGVTQSMLILAISVWAMSALIVGAIFSMIINERQREIGLLRAMGAIRRHIFQLILTEAVILTAIGGVVGVAVSGSVIYGFSAYILDILKVPYLWPSLDYMGGVMLFSLGVGILTGLLGAFYPALRSSLMEPLTAIRRGE